MISLEEYKKALGEEILRELTEEQVLKLRNNDDKMAKLFFDMWLDGKKQKQKFNVFKSLL